MRQKQSQAEVAGEGEGQWLLDRRREFDLETSQSVSEVGMG